MHLQVSKKKFNTNLGTDSNDVIFKEIQSILNKMTEGNYEKLSDQLKKIKINNKEQLEKMVELIFNKAIGEQGFSHMYTKVCRKLITIKIDEDKRINDSLLPESTTTITKKPISFAMVLLSRCQFEFESEINRKIEINVDESSDDIKILDQNIDEKENKESKEKKRRMGLMKFVGELHNVNLLHQKVIDSCIVTMLKKSDDDMMIECACKLLTTVKDKYKDRLDEVYIDIKQRLINIKKSDILTRIKFMVMDLLEKELKRTV